MCEGCAPGHVASPPSCRPDGSAAARESAALGMAPSVLAPVACIPSERTTIRRPPSLASPASASPWMHDRRDQMEHVARVVLALDALEVAEEVMHFLDRSGRARVVGTASDTRQLDEAVRQLEPDAVIAEPALAIGGVTHDALLALATRESVASLRAAVRAGARGFYVWPGEREGLLDGVAATIAARTGAERSATVIAVHGSRGGVGTTFVATHLAAALARADRRCVL